ncbi:class D sortase [Bacillus massiliglaciei]|uniref:class D sortase n=1 Tax=Bacillus massiliglaciei TaxID=1816693 RepID=UPI000AEDFD20|nr:class D sortase [Bacillus massiliglaciei]
MTRIAGVLFLIGGLYLAISNYLDWQEGRSSATELTDSEMRTYETAEAETVPSPPDQPEEESLPHQTGEKVGWLIIPKIEKKFTVYWGTKEEVLAKGVGMFDSELTTSPGQGHTVLSGHRDTVFSGLDELEAGDELIVEYADRRYIYSIEKTWITDKEDRSVIVKKNEPVLTLTTCYPFTYIGNAPERYIIQGRLQ